MNHLPLIIKREYLTKVRNKSFIIMTFLSPIIIIALFSVVAYLSQLNNDKTLVINVLDESGLVEDVFESSDKTTYNLLKNMSLKDAKVLTKEAETYGLLHISKSENIESISSQITFYSEESPSLNVITDLEGQLEKRFTDISFKKNNLDAEVINASKVKVDIIQESFEGKKTSKMEGYFKLGFGILMGYLLLMFIIIYGNMIMRSVIEEKTSRIIEIIISSVKPIQLMLGKIIGTTLAGVTQFVIWAILLSMLGVVINLIFGVNVLQTQTPQKELMEQAMTNPNMGMEIQNMLLAIQSLPIVNLVIAFILFFLCGYLLYSSLYAAIGAAVDNETDTQQFMLPIIMPLMLAFYVGVFTVIEDPHGTVSTVFSFIPLTSPVVMLMRIPFGVPIWQQVLSLLILAGSFIFTVWIAAKIYRVGILMYGKKPSYKEIIKWIKY